MSDFWNVASVKIGDGDDFRGVPASPAPRPDAKLREAAKALVKQITDANDLHAVFTIKDSDEFKDLAAALAGMEGR